MFLLYIQGVGHATVLQRLTWPTGSITILDPHIKGQYVGPSTIIVSCKSGATTWKQTLRAPVVSGEDQAQFGEFGLLRGGSSPVLWAVIEEGANVYSTYVVDVLTLKNHRWVLGPAARSPYLTDMGGMVIRGHEIWAWDCAEEFPDGRGSPTRFFFDKYRVRGHSLHRFSHQVTKHRYRPWDGNSGHAIAPIPAKRDPLREFRFRWPSDTHASW